MSSVKVHNLNGTADCVPKDGADSWLAWWKKKSGKIGLICANTCCSEFAKLGGHVQRHLWGVLTGQLQYPQVGDNERVDTDRL